MRDVHDGGLRHERRILECFFGGAHRLEGHTAVSSHPHPVVAVEAGHGLDHFRVVVGQDDDVLGCRPHPVGVVADVVDVAA